MAGTSGPPTVAPAAGSPLLMAVLLAAALFASSDSFFASFASCALAFSFYRRVFAFLAVVWMDQATVTAKMRTRGVSPMREPSLTPTKAPRKTKGIVISTTS